MEQFLAFILYLILGIYLIRFGFKYIFPWILRKWLLRMVKQMQQQEDFRNSQPTSPPNTHGKRLDNLGEYVEFEEIKDEKPE